MVTTVLEGSRVAPEREQRSGNAGQNILPHLPPLYATLRLQLEPLLYYNRLNMLTLISTFAPCFTINAALASPERRPRPDNYRISTMDYVCIFLYPDRQSRYFQEFTAH